MESEKLINKWTKEFSWLSISNDKAFCEFCKLGNPSSAFSSGSFSLKKSSFKDHEETSGHIDAEKQYHSKKIQARIKKVIRQTDIPTNPELEQTPINFKNLRLAISFLATEDIALKKSPSLLKMLDNCGVSLSSSYRDKHAAHDMVECLASILEDNLMENLKKKSLIGIQIDESTDKSKESILIAYVTFFKDGKACVEYLKSFLLKEKNAVHIYETLSTYLKTKGIFDKVISLCTDGAAVMSSEKNGVAGLFKNELKRKMIYFHCIAHKINLVTTDITVRFKYAKIFQSTIYELVKFFINSPKKIRILDDFQEELIGHSFNLIRPIKVRWFSFFRAIDRIILLWEPICLALNDLIESESDFLATHLLKEISEFKFLFFIHFFKDLYHNLDRISKIFQQKTIDLMSIDKIISTSKCVLESNFFKREDLINLPSIKTFISEIDTEKSTYIQRKINFDSDYEDIIDLCVSISKFTYDDLNIRFPRTDFYNNFEIFEVKYLESCLKKGLNRKEFEQEKLKNITYFLYDGSEQFRYKIQEIYREWNVFKEIFKYISDNSKNLDHFYDLLLDHQKEISNLLTLIEFYFCIQSNSAESERGFSKMNNIKTKNRNQMGIDTLDNLIRISSADEVKLNEISDGCLYDRWKELKIRKSNLIKK